VERLLVSAAALVLTLLAPIAAPADDSGPRREIAAIRHDIPVLLGATPIESVVVVNGVAAVRLHSGDQEITYAFDKRYGRWWYAGLTGVAYDRPSPTPCPLKNCFTDSGFVDTYPASPPRSISFVKGIQNQFFEDWYRLTLQFSTSDAGPNATIESFATRAPTEAESWENYPGGNSYFFFSGTVQSTQPVRVQAGTTLDVWFPFVLDTSQRYSLTIAAPHVMSLGPIDGTLKDNTLHFVLPAFTAPPDAELMGEIESD
jgi:hypothetical protein